MSTKAKDFLPGEKTAVAPNGNIFYLGAITQFKLSFVQVAPVQWTMYKPGETSTLKITFPVGSKTFPIQSQFVKDGKVFIEMDSADGKYTARAELNSRNFNLTPLNNLPIAKDQRSDAESKSDEANYVHDLEGKGVIEKILYSFFGMNWKRNGLLAGAALIAINNFLKGGKK